MKIKPLYLIEINSKQEGKVKISPVGQAVQGLDGRTYDIDGKSMLEYQNKLGIDIHLDENHWSGKAQGWISLSSLEVRSDGIYADIEYTPEGKALVENRSYRYLSPTYIMGEGRDVLGIESVALCNTPNLLNKAINKKESNIMTPDEIKALVEELKQGLKQELLTELKQTAPATEEVEKAVEEVKTAVAEVKETAQEVEELKKEILEANKQTRESRVDSAIATGRLEANKREFALSLNGAQFDAFLNISSVDKSHLKNPADIEKNKKEQVDDVTAEINRQLGL